MGGSALRPLWLLALEALLLARVGCAWQVVGARRKRCLLVDTDWDLDDAMALAYTCVADGFDLRAVTVSATGFTRDAARAVPEVERLLQLCNASGRIAAGRVAVAAGRDARGAPRGGARYRFPAAWSDAASEFFDRTLPDLRPGPPAPRRADGDRSGVEGSAAVKLIVQTAEACLAEGRRMDVVGLGPLTNLAEAVRVAGPLLLSAVSSVYFSGGNFAGHGGNSRDCGGATDDSECNAALDAAALAEVLRSGLRVHMMDVQAFATLPVDAGLAGEIEALGPARGPPSLRTFFAGALQEFVRLSRHPYWYDQAVAVWRHERVLRKDGPDARQERSIVDSALPILGDAGVCRLHHHVGVRVVQNGSSWHGALEPVQGLRVDGRVDVCLQPDKPRLLEGLLLPIFGEDGLAVIRSDPSATETTTTVTTTSTTVTTTSTTYTVGGSAASFAAPAAPGAGSPLRPPPGAIAALASVASAALVLVARPCRHGSAPARLAGPLLAA